ncbi:DUF4097 family beta strand repeat-containing protein [Haloarchaeobius sp. TZWWS8]|uniref:DUF4097 family beta strand repeat-containing protein n=1 Tax=Haloarchaeobius sp. TZWWS8 TaxID=3446121 RepID=UPI003EBF0567
MDTDANEGFLGGLLDGIVQRGTLGSGPELTETVEESVDASDVRRLAVESVNGHVTISPADGDDVTLEATMTTRSGRKQLDRLEVTSTVRDGRLTVRAGPREGVTTVQARADLDIGVPSGVEVESVETANGDVTVSDVSGDLAVQNANGTISVNGVDGYVSLEAANGRIESSGCTGIDVAETANGDVDVEVRRLRRSAEVSAANGSVTVRLVDGLDADVLAETVLGSITVDDVPLDVTSESNRGFLPGHAIVATVGNGGYTLEAEAVTGNVVLTR